MRRIGSVALILMATAAAAPALAQRSQTGISQSPVHGNATAPNPRRPHPSPGFARQPSHEAAARGSAPGHKHASQAHRPRSRGGGAADHASRPRPQFHGGAAGFFVGQTFIRPGSPGRFAGESRGQANHGGFIGWFGPVFWPFAYDDLFDYALWPGDYADYGAVFWAFAYDDLFEGILGPTDGGESSATAAAERSRAGARGLEGQSREFARICGGRALGLARWPIERITATIHPSAEQRAALRNLQAAASEAARLLKTACPSETPATPVGRLDAGKNRLRVLLQSIDLIRPALEKFHGLLSDEQKAQFDAVRPEGAVAAAPTGADEPLARVCCDPSNAVRPIDRVEGAVRPTDAQHDDLSEVRNAAQKAAQILRAACPLGVPRTPAQRLDAMQQRVHAMLDAIETVHPALQSVHAPLSEAQKARLSAGQNAGRPQD